MRKFLLLVFFCAAYIFTKAQTFGNEWIDYTQTHYKIKVVADGIYRIPYATLSSYIPNLGTVPAANFVMYHNGQAIPLNITSSTFLGPGDYIEFYGRKNIGDMDSFLYKNDTLQPHLYYSLFNDTSVYFLTIKSNSANPRFTTVANDLNNLPSKENYYMHINREVYTQSYFSGKYYYVGSDEVYKSTFDNGECYGNSIFFGTISSSSPSQVTTQTFSTATNNLYAVGPAATYRTVFINNSPETHTVNITFNGSALLSQTNTNFNINRFSFPINTSQLSNGANSILFTATGNAYSKRQNVVCLNEIEYPRTFDFSGQNNFYFRVAADGINRKYIEVTNFNDNGLQPVLYDITNSLIIHSTQTSGSTTIKFALPPSNNLRELVLISGDPSTYNTVTALSQVSFVNYSAFAKQGDYVIISNSKLFDDGNGNNRVEEYRKYRDATENPGIGQYVARVADIDQLYDQFAYGIRKSPLSIRNFIQYAKANWSIQPKFIFLLGKGREYPMIRAGGADYSQCLVPTFGFPGSDNLFAATRTSDLPTLAIGRLAAETPQQIKDYLDKVKDYETEQRTYVANQPIAPKDWQKQILHFSGGTTSSEQSLFQGFISNYKNIVQGYNWGANVTTYSKTSSDPISTALAQIISSQINNGVSLITFFGHSATGAFDFSIDEPENYNNTGKYPFIISNGCFAGLIHDVAPGYSERFVLEANKGAIGFMATSSLSSSGGLNNFTSNFYNNFTHATYTKTVGGTLQQTLTDVLNCCSTDDPTMMVAYEMTLHADPAVSINQYPKPDYAIEQPSVYFNPSQVTPGLDSFEVNVVVTNLGMAVKDTIAISLKRTVFDAGNNPVYYNYKKYIAHVYYKDTVSFKLPTKVGTLGYGQNLFEPYVDADFKVDEMAEQNNGLLSPVSIYIQSDDIIPIYPYEFAIDSDKVITLKASTINPFAPVRRYKIEIDTTELFTTPLDSGNILQGGGVVHWTPNIIYKDSTVYYWRVAKDSAGATWHYSSFIYLAHEFPGWNQSHYFQWLKDDFLNIRLDNDRIFKFPATVNNIHVKTGMATAVGGNIDASTLGWDYNNNNMYRFRMGSCGFLRGITFAVIDNITGLPKTSLNYDGDDYGDAFGNYHCLNAYNEQYGFDFATAGNHPTCNTAAVSNIPWTNVIKRFIDSIPNGNYVLVYSTNNPVYTNWDTTLVAALQSLGFQAQLFANGQITGPFTYFTQKGNGSYPSVFDYQNNYNNALDTSINFNGVWYQGQFTSPKIGPAVHWQSMHWKKKGLEFPTADKDTVDVIGITSSGTEVILISTVNPDNIFDTNVVNASTYPYLKLRLRSIDDSLRTPTQLQYWRILYKKAPEAAINPAGHFVFSDSLSLGNNLKLEIGLENVSNVNMDSMLVKYSIRDAALNNYTYYIRHSPLPGLDTIVLVSKQPINGNSFLGLNKLTVEANPDNDQLEQYHFNNFAEINFHTIGDKINPLVDVTFDGQHIFNGDIVSAKPTILITLKDENKFLALNDTSVVTVYVKYPNENTPRRMNYDDVIMKFYPADSANLSHGNKAQVEFKPVFLTDGTYELLIKDKDRSGNNSSSEGRHEGNYFYDYKASFEVINKPMITNVLNYPNPFTTSTKFIFTITGTEIPDYMKIQIITIKGTVVKEITKEELGPLHIGRNITEYAWDGRDQYGDLLANGVYFYHVVTRLDDKRMDQMSMSYDKYFKKGFGKLVIIR